MEEMASIWSYQETMDELRQKLMYTTHELQRLKVESREEMRRNKEYMDQLVQLVHTACRERDEARDQVQKILSSYRLRANSGLTESNSLSADTQNHYSSPVDSLLDPVSSPELADSNGPMVFTNIDQGTLVIDSLAKGKPLPEKGKLLNAVLEAGPLLRTHLLAGPLPRWRNPPQVKPFHIPQVSLCRSCDNDDLLTTHQNPASSRIVNAGQPYFEMSCGSLSSAVLNFGSVPSGSCGGNQMLISSGSDVDCYGYTGKRQRLH